MPHKIWVVWCNRSLAISRLMKASLKLLGSENSCKISYRKWGIPRESKSSVNKQLCSKYRVYCYGCIPTSMTLSETHLGGETHCHNSFWNQVSRIIHESLFTPCSTTDITTHIKLYQTILDNRSFACRKEALPELFSWFQRDLAAPQLAQWKVRMYEMYQPITAIRPSMAYNTIAERVAQISSEPAANTHNLSGNAQLYLHLWHIAPREVRHGWPSQNRGNYINKFGCGPLSGTVTTRIVTYLEGYLSTQ